jgi:hypothetical protein
LDLAEFCPFHKEEHPCSTVFLSAVKFVRKMKGGSQSILVQCDDDRYYVVKMRGNPKGGNTLANEVLGSIIVAAVGLPTAEGKIIHISNSFIESEANIWFESQSGRGRPDAGMHFGSLFLGQLSGPERPTDYISRSRIGAITNRDAFLGMYILDVWAGHQDNRQAVLLRKPDNTQEAFFIDHGQMFGGSEWSFRDRPGAALHLETAVYSELWRDAAVFAWISHFTTVLPDVLRSIASVAPVGWYSGNLQRLLDGLGHRLINLTELVQADAAKLRQFIPHHNEYDILRISDSGIHKLRTPNPRSTLHSDPAA